MIDCSHPDFEAHVEISRLFHSEDCDEFTEPDSVAIDVRAKCSRCGKAVRFEGPVGVAVGPGAPPLVSFDGTELRAAGHLGENRTPAIMVTLK